MPIALQLQTAKLISVHEEPEPLLFDTVNVHPGRYFIPGLLATDEQLANLKVEHRADNEKVGRMVPYASRRTMNGVPYILIEVVEANTYSSNPAREAADRFGVKKDPDYLTVAQPVRAQEVANEIERVFHIGQYGNMGIIAIEGEEPTEDELRRAKRLHLEWERRVIRETNKYFKSAIGERAVTDQARRVAAAMHKRGEISLPDWAVMNPDVKPEDFFACVCGASLRKGSIKCNQPGCGAIHDWAKAVEFGLVKPSDVPQAKRAEAGLSDNQTPEEVPAAVAKGKKGKEVEAQV